MRQLKHEEIPRLPSDQLERSSRHPLRLVLDNVRSAHNVGSVLRTSDGFRIEHVHMCGITPSATAKQVHKVALGAQDFVPWSTSPHALELVSDLKKKGYRVAALEITDQPTLISQVQLADFPLCLVIGNEVSGVSAEVLNECDMALEIPQFGAKQSLNVSVAAGIAIHGLVDQFRTLSDASTFDVSTFDVSTLED